MPPAPQSVSATELATIKNWILTVKVVGPNLPTTDAPIIPAGMTVASDPALNTQAMRVLQVNCAGCHQADAAGGKLTLSGADRLTLTSWISSMALVPVGTSGTGGSPLPALAPTFKSISANILIPKCVGCHGAVRSDGDIRYDSYIGTLRSVSPNNANGSKLYLTCKSGSMPDKPFGKLSANELAAISTWINMGAANN